MMKNLILILFSAALLVQCGNDKNPAAKAKIIVNPKEPIVLLGAPSGTDRTPPYFMFTVRIDNQTEGTFVIVSMKIEVTGISDSGTPITVESYFDPSEKNETFENYECEYTSFGTWAPGVSQELRVDNANTNCFSGPVMFIAESNPKNSAGNYRYRVKVQPIGYFVDADGVATDRFEKFAYFFTR